MARETMTSLIGAVRSMVGDTAQPYAFDDDTIEQALDARRTDHYRLPTRAVSPYIRQATDRNGIPLRGWEDGAVLADSDNDPVEATLIPVAGRFALDEATTTVLLVSGTTYDTTGAAIAIAKQWLARLALSAFDVENGPQKAALNQRIANLRAVIAELGTSRTSVGVPTRSDEVWR